MQKETVGQGEYGEGVYSDPESADYGLTRDDMFLTMKRSLELIAIG